LSGLGNLINTVENVQELKGKPVTFSAKIADGTIFALTVTVPTTFPDGTNEIGRKYFVSGVFCLVVFISRSSSDEFLLPVIQRVAVGGTTFEYAKLEEGSVATPLVRESRITRLAECRKYLFAQSNLMFNSVYVQADYIVFCIPEVVSMRVFPTISNLIEGTSGNATYFLHSGGSSRSGFTLTMDRMFIKANKTNHGLPSATLVFRDSPPVFSAEI
jgi:hypothetical protein